MIGPIGAHPNEGGKHIMASHLTFHSVLDPK